MAAVLAAGMLVSAGQPAAAQGGERIFTIANYPVDATGANAVAAKQEAIANGRRAAFRSLLKRLVPSDSYALTNQLQKLDPDTLIRSVSVRSEENSSTRYIATLDYAFEPDAVRGLLGQHGIPFVAEQAAGSHVVVMYTAPATGGGSEMLGDAGTRAWRNAWSGLDLANSLTPLTIVQQAPGGDRAALLAADPAAIAALGGRHRTAQIIVADAEPLPATKELRVTLAGQDAVGRFSVTTRYKLDEEDFGYSLELAAVVAQGVIESRWKAQQGQNFAGGAGGAAASSLQVLAEFNNLGQWQRQQQALADTPGVSNMQIGSLSGRSASIELSYPGGGNALQAALSSRGLTLENINGFWVLR